MHTSLILASTSAIRQQILRDAGITFISLSPTVDETSLKAQWSSLPAEKLAVKLAEAKALSLHQGNAVVIGADQTLLFNGKVFHKPESLEAARESLLALRGKTHILQSALACARDGIITWTHISHARLTMRNFTDAWLDTYLVGGGEELLSSVGAYKLEGEGIQLFDHIDGDYFTILGLPLLPLLNFLRAEGILSG